MNVFTVTCKKQNLYGLPNVISHITTKIGLTYNKYFQFNDILAHIAG